MKFLCGAQKGFTLLELLISIALLSFIVIIAGGALRMGFRSAESGQRKIEKIERFRTSLTIMEAQLQSAYKVRRTGVDLDETFVQFKGDRSSMQFRSLYSLLAGGKGPVNVYYLVKEDDSGRKAVFGAESPVVLDRAGREIKLFDNASDIYFEYYDRDVTDEKGKWVNEWSSKDNLPEKVRLNIEKDGEVFSLIIPIRVETKIRQFTGMSPRP